MRRYHLKTDFFSKKFNFGAVALTNFKKLMRSPFFMSFQVYKLIFITKCPKKVYTKKALNDFCKAILIFLNLCTF